MGRPSRLWETRVADICSSTAGWILPDAAAFTSSRPPVGKWALSHWAADGGTRRSILRKDRFSAPILWAPAPPARAFPTPPPRVERWPLPLGPAEGGPRRSIPGKDLFSPQFWGPPAPH